MWRWHKLRCSRRRPHWPAPGHSFRHDPPPGNKRSMVEDYYDSELAFADHWLGVLLDDLEARGLLRNTLLIITADHGENVGGEKKFIGHGRRLYQSILQVPLIIAGPGIPAGKKITDPVQLLDLSPTILAYLGIPPGKEMQGRSLLPAILEDQPLPPIPFHFESYGVMVLDLPGLKKLGARSGPVIIGLRSGDHKITYSFKKKIWEMYNIKDDPAEQNNLFAPADPKSQQLAAELRDYYMLRPNPSPPIPKP